MRIKRLIKSLRKRWQSWRFQKRNPVVAERRALLTQAVKQGNDNAIGRTKRGRYVR